MTQRVTVSLPDDVAERLSREPNASAYVAEAVRQQIDREETRALLAAHGMKITPEGMQRARARIDQARAKMTPEKYEALRRIGRADG